LPEIAHELGIGNGPTLADFHPTMAFGHRAGMVVLQVGKLNAMRPLIEGLHVFGQALLVLLDGQ
jgi:hypothetical protein